MKTTVYFRVAIRKALAAFVLFIAASTGPLLAQVTLSGSGYAENFDGMGASGTTLPTGWTVRSAAGTSSRGNAVSITATATVGTSTGSFYNYPNGSGRCIGIRQTGSFGDPGACFELAISNTQGKAGFSLTLDHAIVSTQARSTTWSVQYSTNGTSWVTLGTYADPGSASSTTANYSLGTGLDNQPGTVYIRVVALTSSSGSGVRDSYGLDNVSLSWTNAASCSLPSDIVKNNITDSSVNISWTAASGSPVGYEYAVTTLSTPPASGIAVTGTSVLADSLAQNTKYYVHLRTDCGGGNYSAWITDSATTALPVDLISLSAQGNGRNIQVNWVTAQELNNSHFEVQRSENGRTFQSIAVVKGRGTYRGISRYSFVDENPAAKNYYRLKQVDFDGTYQYSDVVSVSKSTFPERSLDNLVVYPNPVNKESHISYVLSGTSQVNITIYNILGQPVRQVLAEQQEEGAYQLPLPELVKGVYFVRFSIGQYAKATRIIVE